MTEMDNGHELSEQELTELLLDRTGGQPLFIEEALRDLLERGALQWQEGRWWYREPDNLELPSSALSTIQHRLARLLEPTRTILAQASIIGEAFSEEELQAVASVPMTTLKDALLEAVGADLLQETGRDRYSFRHETIRDAIYNQLSASEKRRLHLKVGKALEGLPAGAERRPAAELALHFRKGGDRPQTLRYTMLAGDEAERIYLHKEAEQHYRLALTLAQ